MKTTYETIIPAIPGFNSRDRAPDGWGERVVSKYRKLICACVLKSTNNNIEETARIMGWDKEKLEKYLKSASIEAPGATISNTPKG